VVLATIKHIRKPIKSFAQAFLSIFPYRADSSQKGMGVQKSSFTLAADKTEKRTAHQKGF